VAALARAACRLLSCGPWSRVECLKVLHYLTADGGGDGAVVPTYCFEVKEVIGMPTLGPWRLITQNHNPGRTDWLVARNRRCI